MFEDMLEALIDESHLESRKSRRMPEPGLVNVGRGAAVAAAFEGRLIGREAEMARMRQASDMRFWLEQAAVLTGS